MNPIQFDDFEPSETSGHPLPPSCLVCEQMLSDALDETLTPQDQAWFDRHIAGCMGCSDRMAEAQRGAAWLAMLKTSRPEPSAALLDRILAQTSEAGHANQANQANQISEASDAVPVEAGILPFASVWSLQARLPATQLASTPRARATVLSFPARMFKQASFAQTFFEPRLAMTAAMAFFSIALTLNLTGVRLDQLHAKDLKPANLKRTYFAVNAHAVRFYDNLRVVRVLESRAENVRLANESSQPTDGGASLSQPSQAGRRQLNPDDGTRRVAPATPSTPDPNAPGTRQNLQKAKPEPGVSQRQMPLPEPRLLLSSYGFRLDGTAHTTFSQALQEGGLS